MKFIVIFFKTLKCALVVKHVWADAVTFHTGCIVIANERRICLSF